MKRLYIYLFLSVLSTNCFCQKIIKGTVKDDNGETLVGATVYLAHNTKIGTTTDKNGCYSIEIKDKSCDILVASYIGYIKQYKNLGKGKNQQINFVLKQDIQNLNQVVITGTRTPKLLSEAPIQTRLINNKDIENSNAPDISDLLQQELPNVEFSLAMSQQVNMNLGGFSGQGILFLVDGERLAGETMDNVDYQRLDMNNVERIEIVKGAASALYGSSAAGGVINIITKNKTNKDYTINANARYGSHNNQRYGINIGLNKGIFNNNFSIQYGSIDTYKLDYNPNNDFNFVFGNTSWNFKDKFIVKVTDRLKFTAKAGYFFRERLYNEDTPDRYRDFCGGIRGNWTINKDNNIELSYNYDQYDKSDYIKKQNLDIRDYSNVQNSVRLLFNHNFNRGEQTDILTFGADFMHDYLDSYLFSDGFKAQNTTDMFVQYDWNINKYWEAVAALRYDYFSDGDNSRLTEKLSVRYHKNAYTLRLGYGGGFKAPTLKEKYMNYDMASIFTIHGNKDLKSENSHNLNISAEYTKDYWNVTLSAYYNLLQNRITTSAVKNDYDGSGNYVQYMNIEDINIYGMELSTQMRLPMGLNARMCYSYNKEEIKKVGTLSPYSPTRPHSLVLRLDYDKKFSELYAFNWALNGRFLSSVKSDKYDAFKAITSKVDYPAYMLWKLTLTQRILKHYRITLAVDNIFNYQPKIYYFNSPATSGRTYFINLSVDF